MSPVTLPKRQAIQVSYAASEHTGGQGENGKTAFGTKHDTTHHRFVFSVASLKISRAVPPRQPPPHPQPQENKTQRKKKTRHHRERDYVWSVLKMLTDGPLPLKEPNPKEQRKKKYHASFIPVEYLHRGRQTSLTESRKQIRENMA